MITVKAGKVHLHLYVQPGGKRSEVLGLFDGPDGQSLKIRIHAPPVDGKANDEVLRFVVEALQLPKRSVTLTSGLRSRLKSVEIESVSEDVVREKVMQALARTKK
ncbi:MAG: DUF167 domain-containing protein [Deltaproteobacteria bacterium]|nr:DUF167 domain-containing protein [Deltaproteobacteria bacterium]